MIVVDAVRQRKRVRDGYAIFDVNCIDTLSEIFMNKEIFYLYRLEHKCPYRNLLIKNDAVGTV